MIYKINDMNINIYMQIFAKYILYVCVSLFIYNKHAQYTHTYSIYLANICMYIFIFISFILYIILY